MRHPDPRRSVSARPEAQRDQAVCTDAGLRPSSSVRCGPGGDKNRGREHRLLIDGGPRYPTRDMQAAAGRPAVRGPVLQVPARRSRLSVDGSRRVVIRKSAAKGGRRSALVLEGEGRPGHGPGLCQELIQFRRPIAASSGAAPLRRQVDGPPRIQVPVP
jgi:hypothetical protein